MMNTDGSSSGAGRAESRARVDAERILNAAFDGTLDAAGHMQFAELLRSDPKFRARWAHTARTLAKLRAPTPGSRDMAGQIMSRVHRARPFRAAPSHRRLDGTRLAWAAGLALVFVGVAVLSQMGPTDGPRADGARVTASDTPDARPHEPPQGRPRTPGAAPVTKRPVLAFDSKRYDGDIDLSVKSRVDSPSGGATTLRVFPVADGRLLVTDFEPYPHATAWRDDLGAEPSWWIRAWTRTEPAWAGGVPGD